MITAISAALAVIAIFIAIYAYFNPRTPKSSLVYEINYHRDKKWTHVIQIWNRGQISIGGDKIRTPLRIESNNGKIFEAELIEQSDSIINLKLDIDERALTASWDYLDPNASVLIGINSTEKRAFTVGGAFENVSVKKARSVSGASVAIAIIPISLFIIYFSMYYVNIWSRGAEGSAVNYTFPILIIVVLMLSIGASAAISSMILAIMRMIYEEKRPYRKIVGPRVDGNPYYIDEIERMEAISGQTASSTASKARIHDKIKRT